MACTIEFLKSAAKEFDALDKMIQRRILSYFNQRVLVLDDPRQLGEALKPAVKLDIGNTASETTG